MFEKFLFDLFFLEKPWTIDKSLNKATWPKTRYLNQNN